MRVVSICGTHGAGKTTLIRALISRFVAGGRGCGVIVNEEGAEPYDEHFVQGHELRVATLRGG